MHFSNPEELYTLLETDDHPLLILLLDKRTAFREQGVFLESLFNLFAGYLRILLMDIEYQDSVKEKFQVHGFPASVLVKNRKKTDVLLGVPTLESLREFIDTHLYTRPNGQHG